MREGLKRWRTTLIVVGIFVALAAYVLLVDIKRDPPAEQEPTPTPVPLLSLSVNDVHSMRITSSDHAQKGLRALHILHQDLEWRLSNPDADSSLQAACLHTETGCTADPYIVHIAVDDLCHLSAQRTLLEQPGDLGQYGLAPALLTLDIATIAGQKKTIYIGRQTSDGMSYYVQRGSDPQLYLVAQYTLQPFFDWLQEPPHQTPSLPTMTPKPN